MRHLAGGGLSTFARQRRAWRLQQHRLRARLEYDEREIIQDIRYESDPVPTFMPLIQASDRIITSAKGRQLQADALRQGGMVEWLITRISVGYKGWLLARLATDVPTDYILPAETLPKLRTLLPPGLLRSTREPADPLDVIEVWYST